MNDGYHFVDKHESCNLGEDGQTVDVQGGELMADHMMKAARLAAWFACQPPGGSAALGWTCNNDLRGDGCAKIEATFEEHVMHWTNWCPTEGAAPVSMLETLPFADPATTVSLHSDGSGDGAKHSLFSPEWTEFMSKE
eukprot:1727837-Pyramimonas_sp.AAC.1